jgi:hypothetical protein
MAEPNGGNASNEMEKGMKPIAMILSSKQNNQPPILTPTIF